MKWHVRLINSAGELPWGEPTETRAEAVAAAVHLATESRRGNGLSVHKSYRRVAVKDDAGRTYIELSLVERRRIK